MAVQLGLVGRVGGLLGSSLRDGRQSGARLRSNVGHSYGIGNIVAGAVTYALQSNQGLQ